MIYRISLACFLFVAMAASGPSTTLRQAADSAGVLVGTAVRPSLFSEAAYAEILGREFSMVEPEDAMKWQALRPNASTFDFEQGDEVVKFAKAHGMKVRGHCLYGRSIIPTGCSTATLRPSNFRSSCTTTSRP